MSDTLSTDLAPPEAPPEASTQLDEGRPYDPGQAQHREPAEAPPAPPPKKESRPETRLEAIKRAAADVEAASAEKAAKDGEAKPEDGEPDAKAAKARAADGKFAPRINGAEAEAPETEAPETEAPEGEQKNGETPEARQRRAADKLDAPRTFLPRAKELWHNTPREVQAEVGRLTREHDEEIARHTEATQRYEAIKPFDDLARSNGRDLRDSLARVNQLENLMRQSPLAGLNAVLQEIGPKKADGQALSLYEVAQYVAGLGPDGYQQIMGQARQQSQGGQQSGQQAQPNPEIEQLRQQLQAMQHQQLAAQIIDPFKARHPRYDELQDDIAFFLESGKIPKSLSPQDRLSAAYDMAERINPPSRAAFRPSDEAPAPDSRADPDFSGSKSVRGAPATGVDVATSRKRKMSRAEAINAAMSELGFN